MYQQSSSSAPSFSSGPNGRTGAPTRQTGYLKKGAEGVYYVDYKSVDELRRMMTPNGKIYSRKRLGVSARDQRMISQAIKRARAMALLPYTSATL